MVVLLTLMAWAGTVQGTVFRDEDGDGVRDEGEVGLPGVVVSNQREVVVTDENGGYRLPVDGDAVIFLVKPDDYDVLTGADGLPRFYYVHRPTGSPRSFHPGVEPTGKLPKSVDFGLVPSENDDAYNVILWADPQPASEWEMQHVLRDGVEPLVGTDSRFMAVLGDIVHDRLDLLPEHSRGVGFVGVPVYHVVGNHDLNLDAIDDESSDETFERFFGPGWYSFDEGVVHFVVLDDVIWEGEDGYRGGLGDTQLEWLRADLARADPAKPLVLLSHIPLVSEAGRPIDDLGELMQAVSGFEQVYSFSGHTHTAWSRSLGKEDGWQGPGTFDQITCATLSGSWWSGPLDAEGIPDALQTDGTPNGWTVVEIDGTKVRWTFHAAGGDGSDQVRAYEPRLDPGSGGYLLMANVFYGSEYSKVAWRIDDGEWQPMERFTGLDPLAVDLFDGAGSLGKPWVEPSPTGHLWRAAAPADLPPGLHMFTAREVDRWGREHVDSTGFRVE